MTQAFSHDQTHAHNQTRTRSQVFKRTKYGGHLRMALKSCLRYAHRKHKHKHTDTHRHTHAHTHTRTHTQEVWRGDDVILLYLYTHTHTCLCLMPCPIAALVCTQIVAALAPCVVVMSMHKFASNVIEKCLAHGNIHDRDVMVRLVPEAVWTWVCVCGGGVGGGWCRWCGSVCGEG